MDLLNRLSKQANELWQKQAACMNQARKEQLLKEYKTIYSQYQKHKEWLRMMDSH